MTDKKKGRKIRPAICYGHKNGGGEEVRGRVEGIVCSLVKVKGRAKAG